MLEQPRKREKRYAPGKGEDSFRNKNRVDTLDRPFHYERRMMDNASTSRSLEAEKIMDNNRRSAVRSEDRDRQFQSSEWEYNGRKAVSSAAGKLKNSVNNANLNNAARKASGNAANSFKKSASRASSVTSMFEKEFGKKKPSKR